MTDWYQQAFEYQNVEFIRLELDYIHWLCGLKKKKIPSHFNRELLPSIILNGLCMVALSCASQSLPSSINGHVQV